jgi:hypothetical protein
MWCARLFAVIMTARPPIKTFCYQRPGLSVVSMRWNLWRMNLSHVSWIMNLIGGLSAMPAAHTKRVGGEHSTPLGRIAHWQISNNFFTWFFESFRRRILNITPWLWHENMSPTQKAPGTRFAAAISYFKPGPQKSNWDIFIETPCRMKCNLF